MQIFYLILSLIFLGVVIWRPKWGGLIILATLPSYLLRLDIFGIPTTVLELNIWLWFVVTVICWFCTRRVQACLYPTVEIRQRLKKIFHNQIFNLFLIFIGIGLFSTLVADDIRLALGAWKGWMLDPALFLLAGFYNYDQSIKTKLIYATMFTTGFVALWALVEYIGGFGMQLPGVVNAMFTSANYVALLIIPLWFLAVGLWLENLSKSSNKVGSITTSSHNRVRQAGWIIFHLIVLVTILLTKSYAGLLALGAGGLYILIMLPKDFKYKKIFISLAIIAAIILASLVITSDKFTNLKNTSDNIETYETSENLPTVGSYNSLQTRQQIWTATTDLIKNNLWLGIGFGNFEPEYYHRAFELYNPPLEWEVPRAHNLFLHTWAEMGIFGLVVFIILLIQVLLNLKQLLKNQKNYFIKISIIAAVLSVIIHGLLDTPYYKNDLSIVFVLLLLLTILENKK